MGRVRLRRSGSTRCAGSKTRRGKAVQHERRTVSFLDYWNAVDAAMPKLFSIDTCDASIDAKAIASAQDEVSTPDEFARWCGDKYVLDYVNDIKALYGAIAKAKGGAA